MSIAIGLALRLGKFVLGNPLAQVVLLVLAAYAFGQWQGRSAGREACEARYEAAIAREEARQQRIIAEAVAGEKARADAAETIAAQKQLEIAGYEAELRNQAGAACLLTPDDAGRLQSIAR